MGKGLFGNDCVNDTDNENEIPEELTILDILNIPVDYAISKLVQKGVEAVKSAKQTARDTYKTIYDEEYKKFCKPVLTMDECISWMKIQRGIYSQAGYFFIYAEENPQPRNENDMYSIALALLDSNKKPICVNGEKTTKLFQSKAKDIVCVVIPAKTVDSKLLNALNGNESVLVKL